MSPPVKENNTENHLSQLTTSTHLYVLDNNIYVKDIITENAVKVVFV